MGDGRMGDEHGAMSEMLARCKSPAIRKSPVICMWLANTEEQRLLGEVPPHLATSERKLRGFRGAKEAGTA